MALYALVRIADTLGMTGILIVHNKDLCYQWIGSNVDFKTGISTTWNQSTEGLCVKMKVFSLFFLFFLIFPGNGIPITKVRKWKNVVYKHFLLGK